MRSLEPDWPTTSTFYGLMSRSTTRAHPALSEKSADGEEDLVVLPARGHQRSAQGQQHQDAEAGEGDAVELPLHHAYGRSRSAAPCTSTAKANASASATCSSW